MLRRIEQTLFFLTILFLPTQLGKHFWPSFSYIYSLKIDYLSPTLYFWDILVMALMAVWFLSKPRVNFWALNLLLFFLFTQSLSLIGASNVEAGLIKMEQLVLVGFFGVYIASESLENLSKKIFLPLTLGILGESIIAILQFTRGSTLGLWILGERTFTISTPAIAKFDFNGTQVLRPYATFPHPNVLAGFMIICLALLGSVLYAKNTTGLTYHLGRIAVFLSGATIFLTMSRTAILAGFITAAVLFRRKWTAILIGVAFLLSPVLFARFSSLINFDNLTLLRREELSVSSLKMFLKFPIFGVGLNNFIPSMAGNLISGPNRFFQPVHNIFLLSLSETGIVGFLGLLGLLGYPIKKIFKNKFSIVNLLPWFIIFFLGLFDHYFFTLPQGYRLLFLIWGLSFSMLK